VGGVSDLTAKLNALIDEGLSVGECLNAFSARHTPPEKAYVAAALKHQRDGELEIDSNAVVSLGDDPGSYVQAWIWVKALEAGVEEGEA